MPIKSVSTNATNTPLTGSTLLAVSTSPCTIYDIEGYCTGASGSPFFIQILGTAAPSSGVTVPLWSRMIQGGTGFSFVYRPTGIDTANLNLGTGPDTPIGANASAVYMAISSTDNVWTSTATATDVSVDYEDTYLETITATKVGPTATIDSLTVFADPSPQYRLTEFTVTNNSGATAYLMLFGYAAPAVNSIPLQQWTVANGATITEKLGRGITFQQCKATLLAGIATPTDYVPHYGCYLVGSSTTQALTITTGGQWTMLAYYVPNQ